VYGDDDDGGGNNQLYEHLDYNWPTKITNNRSVTRAVLYGVLKQTMNDVRPGCISMLLVEGSSSKASVFSALSLYFVCWCWQLVLTQLHENSSYTRWHLWYDVIFIYLLFVQQLFILKQSS